MKTILNSKEMKEVDRHTIEDIGVPSMVLMERAALSVARELEKKITKKDKILCLCGSGNNGGDGLAVARMLYQKGYLVEILFLGNKDKRTLDAKLQYDIAKKIGVPFRDDKETIEYTIIVDAIFGIGLARDINGAYKKIINQINNEEHYVCAVDIPSGICGTTGKVMGTALRADLTVTFGYWKTGLVLYPGADYAGEVVVSDIGFVVRTETEEYQKYLFTEEDLKQRLPARHVYSNKGTYGKLLILAGSKNMSGACYLSAKAAYRTGAGLVRIITHSENRTILQNNIPEAIMDTYSRETFDKDCERIKQYIIDADAIVIGPGIGKEKEAKELVELVLEHSRVPTVIDADALHILVKTGRILPYQNGCCNWNLAENFILTPHRKEMATLLGEGITISYIQENLFDILRACSQNLNILVLKDARTVVLKEKSCYINISGNDGMATAGSGDVLTGIIAGLAGQGLKAKEAATLGVYLHGLAGDASVEKKGKYSLMASDIIEGISDVLVANGGIKDEGIL